MSENLQGSQILELAEQIKQKIREGENIYNLTIGDFDPEIFPIPEALRQDIVRAYDNGQTRYPASNGMPELREAAAEFTRQRAGLDYDPGQFLVSSGARPLIYAAYTTLIDPGDKVIYPVPSWNNNFYTHIVRSGRVEIETKAEDGFMPTAAQLAPHVEGARLIALCSPLNPTGTTFTAEQLSGICELVLAENKRRGPEEKPLYLLYDQIYWNLTYGETEHYNPVSLYPEMKDYTIFIDGMSKAFAATGLRIGWAFGPSKVIGKMKLLLAHVGAWSARPEQMGAARYLTQENQVSSFLEGMRRRLNDRLVSFYDGFQDLKNKGFAVDAIEPQAALYLTVKLDLIGAQRPDGQTLSNSKEVYAYLLNEANVALVPFYAFGLTEQSPWYRLSVGTARMSDIPVIFEKLEAALKRLQSVAV
ncbi:MAG: aminotransferase class I/II-fold pyridoxal phosphate-dependent enzyme [Bacteroidota bacterium]